MADSEIHQLLYQHIEHPIFQIPIVSFMEENCIIFSNDVPECPEYKVVYEEYKAIVNDLLTSFCEDMSFNMDDLMGFIKKMESEWRPNNDSGPHPGIQKILALHNYALFVELMQNLNDDLQRQALLIIQQQFASGALVLGDGDISYGEGTSDYVPAGTENMSEEELIAMVMKISADEYKTSQLKNENGNDVNDFPPPKMKIQDEPPPDFYTTQPSIKGYPVLNKSSLDSGDNYDSYDKKNSTEQKTDYDKKEKLKDAPESSSHSSPTKEKKKKKSKKDQQYSSEYSDYSENKPCSSKQAPPLLAAALAGNERTDKSGSDAANDWLKKAQQEAQQIIHSNDSAEGGVSSEDLEKRQLFIREQRDKLVAKKKEERQRQIKSLESFTKERPASARAAQSVLDKKPKELSAEEEQERKKIERRRVLASKLKTEVVEKK